MASDKSVMALIRALKPTFRNDHDKVAFAVHATFLATGHVLTATGSAACSDTALSSPSTDEVGIDHWNELDDNYAFVYVNPENGSKKVLVKCLVMNDKLLVDALADGKSEPVHLEIRVGDYANKQGGSDYSSQFKNLEKLVESLDTEVLAKFHGSSKPSSSETSEASRRNTNDPAVGFSEPIGPHFHPSGPHFHPAGVLLPPVFVGGFSDMFPGPPAGMYPRGDFGSDGGMLVGPGHPMFGRNERDFVRPGGLPGVPPGARFDPYGPPGVPGFEPNRFVRNPRRPRPGGGGVHPDLEHFGGGSGFI